MEYSLEFWGVYLLVGMICWIICGIVSAAIGSSFWWGFWFGPIGILIAAVRVSTQRKPQIIIVGDSRGQSLRSANNRIQIRRNRALPAPPKSETEIETFERIYADGERKAAARR